MALRAGGTLWGTNAGEHTPADLRWQHMPDELPGFIGELRETCHGRGSRGLMCLRLILSWPSLKAMRARTAFPVPPTLGTGQGFKSQVYADGSATHHCTPSESLAVAAGK